MRRKALSSLLVEDCEAYKDFFGAVAGVHRTEASPRQRPLAAVRPRGLVRRQSGVRGACAAAAFAWLATCAIWRAIRGARFTNRRLSRGNRRCRSIGRCRRDYGLKCARRSMHAATGSGADSVEADDGARQWRAARAAILLMGDSGLRRAEATLARREGLAVLRPRRPRIGVSRGASSESRRSASRAEPASAPPAGLDGDHCWQAPQAAHGTGEQRHHRRTARTLG